MSVMCATGGEGEATHHLGRLGAADLELNVGITVPETPEEGKLGQEAVVEVA